jgi:hypothetical protein
VRRPLCNLLRIHHLLLRPLTLVHLGNESIVLVEQLDGAIGDRLLEVAVVALELSLRALEVVVGCLEVLN